MFNGCVIILNCFDSEENGLEKWEKYLREIIQLPVQDEYLKRGSEIKHLLSDLSKYHVNLELQFKNVQNNESHSINELIGAVQRYIYGNFLDAITHSCYSVEIGLLLRLDETLNNEAKISQREPTLGRIMHLSYEALILDKNDNRLKKAASRLLELRNIHNHPINFLSGLMLSYKELNKLLNASKLDLATIEDGLKILSEQLPEGNAKLILKKYKPEDIAQSMNKIESLSSFEWCANKRYFRSLKREIDKSVKDIRTKLTTGKDLDNLMNYFQDYILRKEALESLKNANVILKYINVL
jgi:hypothetical protein